MDRVSSLKRALDTLFEARRDLYNLTNGLSDEEMNFKPAADSWSVGEVMDHIIKTESYFAGDLKRTLLTFGDEPAGDNLLSHVMRPFIFAGMHYGSTLIKFEAPEGVRPVFGFPHLYLVYKLAQVREATFDVAERLAHQPETIYMVETRLGTHFSGEDWLYLTGLHEARHVKQVERILGKLEESNRGGGTGPNEITTGTGRKQLPAMREEETVAL